MLRTCFVAVIRDNHNTPLRFPVYRGSDYFFYARIGDQFMKLTDITDCGYKVELEG